MVNYKVENNNVVETKTNQIIASGITPAEAKAMVRHLNFGGGFDGNTPSFFLANTQGLVFEDESFYK